MKSNKTATNLLTMVRLPKVGVVFKFNNHVKIILKNKMVYWGASNFSDESKKNYKRGTILAD